jgi:hypothetical protein
MQSKNCVEDLRKIFVTNTMKEIYRLEVVLGVSGPLYAVTFSCNVAWETFLQCALELHYICKGDKTSTENAVEKPKRFMLLNVFQTWKQLEEWCLLGCYVTWYFFASYVGC